MSPNNSDLNHLSSKVNLQLYIREIERGKKVEDKLKVDLNYYGRLKPMLSDIGRLITGL